ncbi:Glycoside hydrolase family 92 protein [Pleurostoma richardsiae]|uniref:Glycoside hydrolase family 92 protein n=1 Tax=Pleurostoma richardsiae TaxID=41990 RepID=A0AA38RNH2_9PEZI|nr:Glycoside hydrolase family 92 protein [Pleurostoma richardsiae]
MPPRKRQAPETPETSGGRRRSTRISSSGKKSLYFEDDSDDELGLDDGTEGRSRELKKSRGRSANKRAKVEEDDSDGYNDEETAAEDGEEEEEEEEEVLDDDDDDRPRKVGRVTIIPLPKLRDTGGVDYEDTRLHKNTLLFLKDLKANNKRDWLKGHDNEYRRSLKDFESFVETLTEKIIEADGTIPELPLKDVIFRIYRDIRFSNDPTPYKPHYGAAWSRTGRKGPYACYYVHVEPGKCFVGGGLWHPDAGHLAKLRASIDERPRRWRRVLMDDRFRRTFLPGAKAGDEKAALKAFTNANQENALKTKPKGFISDHRDIELLKLRNFTVGKKVADNIFTAENAQEQIIDILGAMVGYVNFLNGIVMPDFNLDDDESSEEEEEEEEGGDDE